MNYPCNLSGYKIQKQIIVIVYFPLHFYAPLFNLLHSASKEIYILIFPHQFSFLLFESLGTLLFSLIFLLF